MSPFHFVKLFTFSVVLFPLIVLGQIDSKEESFVIDSKILSEKISITTYDTSAGKKESIIYITDGQKMIDYGTLEQIKLLTDQGKIPEAFYVFVSTIDAETNEDKRNTYFFCNDDYLGFFEKELIPQIEGTLSRKLTPAKRSLIGVSFGGLNAAYFSGKTTLFQNYALLSPITYPCKEVLSTIAFSENKDLRILLTTGKNDAENYLGALKGIYESKGYEVQDFSTDGAHDFENWNNQMERVLNFLK